MVRGWHASALDYYPGFEVVAVEPLGDDRFEARIEFTLYSGGTYHETITMAPGRDVDGFERDLVIVDARPG